MARTGQITLGGTLKFAIEDDGYVLITVRYDNFTLTAKGDHMAYTLASGFQVHVQVAYVDAAGNPAVVDGPVQWSSSDTTIVTVTVDGADSSKALVAAAGPVGQAQVIATADADLGSGVRTLTTPMDVTIAAGEAVSGTISPVGPAEPIP